MYAKKDACFCVCASVHKFLSVYERERGYMIRFGLRLSSSFSLPAQVQKFPFWVHKLELSHILCFTWAENADDAKFMASLLEWSMNCYKSPTMIADNNTKKNQLSGVMSLLRSVWIKFSSSFHGKKAIRNTCSGDDQEAKGYTSLSNKNQTDQRPSSKLKECLL